MPNNGAYNNQASSPAERNVGPVGLTRLPVAVTPSSWIFQEDWSSQPDWVARAPVGTDYVTLRWAGDEIHLPPNWDAVYDSGGSYSANPNIEIGDSVFPGLGRCLRVWRENKVTNPAFHSNGCIGKLFDTGTDEAYVEFEIVFMDGFTTQENGSTKVFRIFSSTGQTNDFWQAFDGGEQGPLFLWDWSASSTYGLRNRLAFRGGPHGNNYGMNDVDLAGIGRNKVPGSLGDIDMNFSDHIQGKLTGGLSPQIPDKLNGGFLPTSGVVVHEQVFGVAGTKTKLGFYVKMNSAPDVADGVFKQFIDDVLVVDSDQIRWVGPTAEPMPKWNAFALGGNDDWAGGSWDDSDQREEFYEIHDVNYATSLPQELA